MKRCKKCKDEFTPDHSNKLYCDECAKICSATGCGLARYSGGYKCKVHTNQEEEARRLRHKANNMADRIDKLIVLVLS